VWLLAEFSYPKIIGLRPQALARGLQHGPFQHGSLLHQSHQESLLATQKLHLF
jgi:hypothetical protein